MAQEDSIVALADQIMGGFLSSPTVDKANIGSETGEVPNEMDPDEKLLEITDAERNRLLEHAAGETVQTPPTPAVEQEGVVLSEEDVAVLKRAAAILNEMATTVGAIGVNMAGSSSKLTTPGNKQIHKGIKKASKKSKFKDKKAKLGDEVDDQPFEKRTKEAEGQGRTKTGRKNMKHPWQKEDKSFDDFVQSILSEHVK